MGWLSEGLASAKTFGHHHGGVGAFSSLCAQRQPCQNFALFIAGLAKEVLKAPESSPNASHKLAGQLALQLEHGPQQPAVQELCREVILPGSTPLG